MTMPLGVWGPMVGIPARFMDAKRWPIPSGCEDWPRSLVRLGGPNGTGKTTFATRLFIDWACQCAVRHGWPSWNELPNAQWITLGDMADAAKASWGDGFEYDWSIPEVLLIDDLIDRRATDFEIDLAEKVIVKRHNMNLPTIITTNKELSEIDTKSPKLASTLAGFDHSAWLTGADLRAK